MSLLTCVLLVWLHFVADFLLQSDYVAKNKSTSNKVLVYHVVLYSIPFFIVGVWFAIVNALLHFVVDFCTSRVTRALWNKGNVRWFFVTIGFDQAMHLTCLFLTYMILN